MKYKKLRFLKIEDIFENKSNFPSSKHITIYQIIPKCPFTVSLNKKIK